MVFESVSDDLLVCSLHCSEAPGPMTGHRWDQPRKRIGWEGKGKFLRVLRGGRGIQDSVTDNRRGWGGLISRLCVHFFLVFGSRGWPISFPRSFSPVHGRR